MVGPFIFYVSVVLSFLRGKREGGEGRDVTMISLCQWIFSLWLTLSPCSSHYASFGIDLVFLLPVVIAFLLLLFK